jgi:parallel beta-helix repeat protein
MNSLRITLNDGKRFLAAAGLAAVLVLLVGGANALANTVWCVPNTSISTACTPGDGKTHIQDAIYFSGSNVASPGDVVLVGPGYYNETVYVPVSNLSILGAQAGKDARLRPNDPYHPSKESIVDATPTAKLYGSGGGATFFVNAEYVVIDGFTIQGGTAGYAAGVFIDAVDYDQILNNIIQNNAVGISLYYAYYGNLIEYNLIQDNNYGTPSSFDYPAKLPGVGIAGSEPEYGTTITENAFEKNLAAAMFFNDSYALEITRNTSKDDGSFVIFYDCTYTYFDHNQGQNFGAKGVWPFWTGYSADAAVDLIYEDTNMEINDNDLEGGKVAGYSGIAASNIYSAYENCEYCQISNNTICHFKGNGIVAELPTSSESTLSYSLISMNDVEDNGGDGILIEGSASTDNYKNSLFDNKAKDNGGLQCADYTTGSWTLGTYDTWVNNSGSPSYPSGLCTHVWH